MCSLLTLPAIKKRETKSEIISNLSPSLCQSVVAEVEDKLVERVWLDLSHLLFLLLHNFHWGFLQESTGVNS